jgi:hypothetical protein
VNWYRKAAEQGLAVAHSGLGQCYYNGYGVESNAVEAVNWYRKAAEQGLADAQIISLVKKNAFTGEKGLDTISPVW